MWTLQKKITISCSLSNIFHYLIFPSRLTSYIMWDEMNQSLVTWIVGIPTPLDRRGDATKFPGYSDILIVWLGKQCICVDIAPRMDLLAISIREVHVFRNWSTSSMFMVYALLWITSSTSCWSCIYLSICLHFFKEFNHF